MLEKHKKFIQLLLSQEVPVPAVQIAKQLELSVRTLRNYTAEINQQQKIIQGTKYGYQISNKEAAMVYLSANNHLPESYQERANYYLKRWLIDREYLPVGELADQLFISESTFKNDLKQMNKTFQPFGLSFNIRQNYPQVHGSETDRRQVIHQLLLKNQSLTELHDQHSEFPWSDLKMLILSAFQQSQAAINDVMLDFFTERIFILLKRVRGGRNSEQVWQPFSQSSYEGTIAQSIQQSIENEYRIQLTKTEWQELCFLVGITISKLPPKTTITNNQLRVNLQHILLLAAKKYQLELEQPEILESLFFHIDKLLKRAPIGLVIQNPYETQIAQNYPLLLEIELFIMSHLNLIYNLQLQRYDKGFIALHLGRWLLNTDSNQVMIKTALVFPDYLDYREKMLVSLQENFYHKLEIIYSGADFPEKLMEQTDLLLSSFPQESISVPTLPVSFAITESEKSVIWRFIRTFEKRNQRQVKDVLVPDLFIMENQDITKEAALDKLLDLCEAKGLIDSSFRSDVWARETLYPTEQRLLAVPHALETSGRQTAIAVLFSPKGILWENEWVHLIVLPIFTKEAAFSTFYPAIWESFVKAAKAATEAPDFSFEKLLSFL